MPKDLRKENERLRTEIEKLVNRCEHLEACAQAEHEAEAETSQTLGSTQIELDTLLARFEELRNAAAAVLESLFWGLPKSDATYHAIDVLRAALAATDETEGD